jgi:plasmid stabilization system protein ParE
MAKRKIIWSHRAKIKLAEILEFYHQRNNSKAYSQKVYQEIQKGVRLLQKQPKLGLRTDDESIRTLIIGDFLVFYEFTKSEIIVHLVWDCQQNSADIKIK